MQSNYYFLSSLLPSLQMDHFPELKSDELRWILSVNLNQKDLRQLIVILRYYDLENLRALWLGQEIDPRGYFNVNELEDALISEIGFPDYVYEFLKKYENVKDRLRHFSELLQLYFYYESESAEGFLKEYLSFERKTRFTLGFLRAKEIGSDFSSEIVPEEEDSEVLEGFQNIDEAGLKMIYERYRNTPLLLHQALCLYRFQEIDKLCGTDLFSIDKILSYFVQLILVEKWFELDRKRGLQMIGESVRYGK